MNSNVTPLLGLNDRVASNNPLAKFAPPAFGYEMIPRSILVGYPAANRILLTAPAGFGKTVALAQQFEQSARAGKKARWLSLSSQDNDPDRLQRNLAKAFVPEIAHCEEDVWEAIEMMHGTMSLSPDLAVFLDGIDRISNEKSVRLLDDFISGFPTGPLLYMASRRLQGYRFLNAQLDGSLKVITEQALCLTDDQCAKLLGSEWSYDDACLANRLTEGWAAGLRLLSIEPEAARALLNQRLEVQKLTPLLYQYIDREIAGMMPNKQVEAVLLASVFDRFTSAMLGEIPEMKNAWANLEALAEEGLVVRYLDPADRTWLSLRPIFGRYFRARLTARDSKQLEALQDFAAEWFQQHGHPDEAIRLALRMHDTNHATRIMEEAGALRIELRSGTSIPVGDDQDNHGANFPLVSLGRIYTLVRTGRLATARKVFEQLRKQSSEFSNFDTGGNSAGVVGFARMIEAILNGSEDREVDENSTVLLEQEFAAALVADPILAGAISSLLALSYMSLGRTDEAMTICNVGLNLVRDFGDNPVTIFLLFHQGRIAIARGQLADAAAHFDAAAKALSTKQAGTEYEAIVVRVFQAELAYELDDLETASHLLRPALQCISQVNGWFELYASLFGTAAMIAALTEGHDAASKLLDLSDNLARQRNMPRLVQQTAVDRLREATRAGKRREAVKLLETEPLASLVRDETDSDPLSAWHLRVRTPALIEASRLMLDLGRKKESCDYLARVRPDYLEKADIRLRFGFHVMAMQTAFQLRRYNDAFAHLQTVLEEAATHGLSRRLLNHRSSIISMTDWSSQNGRRLPSHLKNFVDHELRNVEDAHAVQQSVPLRSSKGSGAVRFALSPRETEVICLIAEGYLTKEIAYRLGISEGTVKTHRKNINAKLGVSSRSQAIRRARELLIL